jgi:hypothetical protein
MVVLVAVVTQPPVPDLKHILIILTLQQILVAVVVEIMVTQIPVALLVPETEPLVLF